MSTDQVTPKVTDQIAYGGGRQDAERVGRWMQTYRGEQFWPLDPRVEEIDIRDIGPPLGKLCRYGGHCKRFYSVAEHCVHVARFAPAPLKLTALLHDASEAYLVDMPRPIKASMPDYQRIEAKLERAIAEKFGLIYPWPAEVKLLDNRILRDEMEQNMATPRASWELTEPALGVRIECWQPWEAELQFMYMFNQLMYGR